MLDLMLCCHIFEIPNNFLMRDLFEFSFCTISASFVINNHLKLLRNSPIYFSKDKHTNPKKSYIPPFPPYSLSSAQCPQTSTQAAPCMILEVNYCKIISSRIDQLKLVLLKTKSLHLLSGNSCIIIFYTNLFIQINIRLKSKQELHNLCLANKNFIAMQKYYPASYIVGFYNQILPTGYLISCWLKYPSLINLFTLFGSQTAATFFNSNL